MFIYLFDIGRLEKKNWPSGPSGAVFHVINDGSTARERGGDGGRGIASVLPAASRGIPTGQMLLHGATRTTRQCATPSQVSSPFFKTINIYSRLGTLSANCFCLFKDVPAKI